MQKRVRGDKRTQMRERVKTCKLDASWGRKEYYKSASKDNI